MHLMSLPDPAERDKWGGAGDDLQRIHEHRRCIADLEDKIATQKEVEPQA